MMTDDKVLSTDYFHKSWTWYKRLGYFMFFVFLVTAWEIAEDPWDFWWIKYAILTFLSLGLLLSPVDDIAIDDTNFYHIKRSLLKFKDKIDKYDLTTIKSVRCLGVHVPGLSLQEMVGTNRQLSTETNTIEITFKDGTYKSLDLAIYKKELIFYAEKIRERLK